MISIMVSALAGDEILSKDVTTQSGVVLIPAGTALKKAYIRKLMELGINSVCIKNAIDVDEMIEEEKKETSKECSEKIRNLIEKHFYSTTSELSEVASVAENIISDVMNQPEVLMSVTNLRHSKNDLYLHSVNVCAISVLLAINMKLKENYIRNIAVGALLHDIGYSYVNAKIQKNITDKNIENEEIEKKKHVIYGYEMVEHETWISKESKNIILNHHERVDGSGYPFKRKGSLIDTGSKIVAVADTFDNVINGKTEEHMKVYQAVDKIVSQGGTAFDYKVIEEFRSCVSVYPIGTIVITNNKEIGIVVKQNKSFPTRPVIKVIRDAKGNDVKEYIIRDLTKELTVFVEDTIE